MARPALASHVPGLDTVLNGGFHASGVYIIQGPPGAGKTILANQICFAHAAQGGKAAYVTLLTESIPRMFENLATLTFFDESQSPDQVYYVSAFNVLESEGLQGLMRLLRGEISSRSPTVLVLDGIVSASERAKDKLEFRKFIHELQGYASLFTCTIFLIGTTSTDSPVQIEHTMVEGVLSLVDAPQESEAQRYLHVSKFRGRSHIGGRHALTITGSGVEVFPRLESFMSAPSSQVDNRAPLSTGITGLDRLTRVGGLRSSSSTLVVGPGGAGKTMLGVHFLGGCSPEQPGLLFSFNEPPDEVLRNAAGRGLHLDRMASAGILHTDWRPTVENIPDEVGHRILRLVGAHHTRRVFVDGLDRFVASTVHPQRMDRFIAALTLELRRLGATSVFSIESADPVARLPGSVRHLPALFDNLISLRTLEAGSRIRRLMSITKMRGCHFDESLHTYRLTHAGIEVGEAAEFDETTDGLHDSPASVRAGHRRA